MLHVLSVEEDFTVIIDDNTLVVTMSLESTGDFAEDEQTIENARISVANWVGSDESQVIIVSTTYVNEGADVVLTVQYLINEVDCNDESLIALIISESELDGILSVECASSISGEEKKKKFVCFFCFVEAFELEEL